MTTPTKPLESTVKHVLQSLIASQKSPSGNLELLRAAWQRTAGSFLATHARPARLLDTVLEVETDLPSLEEQIQALLPDLLERLVAATGLRLTDVRARWVRTLSSLASRMPPPIPPPPERPPSSRGPQTLPLEADRRTHQESLGPIFERLLTHHRRRQAGETSCPEWGKAQPKDSIDRGDVPQADSPDQA